MTTMSIEMSINVFGDRLSIFGFCKRKGQNKAKTWRHFSHCWSKKKLGILIDFERYFPLVYCISRKADDIKRKADQGFDRPSFLNVESEIKTEIMYKKHIRPWRKRNRGQFCEICFNTQLIDSEFSNIFSRNFVYYLQLNNKSINKNITKILIFIELTYLL